jgi:hypothetical protein
MRSLFTNRVPVYYRAFLPEALALAQRARAIAAILARAAGLILRLDLLAAFVTGLPALTLAQRAFCAAIIAALPAALILDFRLGAAATVAVAVDPPKYRESSFWSDAIFSCKSAACRSC